MQHSSLISSTKSDHFVQPQLLGSLPLTARLSIMQALITTAAQQGVRQTTPMHCTCRAAVALQCRGIASAHQTAADDAYDVVVFGGGMVGVAFAALLGAYVGHNTGTLAAGAARPPIQVIDSSKLP